MKRAYMNVNHEQQRRTDDPDRIRLNSKVWVPVNGKILAGVVIHELTYGDFIVEVRGKQYQYGPEEVKLRQC